ncbi:hypothetical protein LTR27_004561 [Elasticomyces elasticus]|nr:hypothetical protein LTR27_004561 [Elasticomyces elasticus]
MANQAVISAIHQQAAHPALKPPAVGCPFLSLPREMRNRIYDYTSVEVLISEPQQLNNPEMDEYWNAKPRVHLKGVPSTELLCVNKQVNSEYAEHVSPGSGLVIDTQMCEFPRLSDLEIQPNVPTSTLSKVKNVKIDMFWFVVVDADRNGTPEFYSLCDALVSSGQAVLPWTPSKYTRVQLLALIAKVHPLVRPDARVTVAIDLDEFPIAQDLYTWTKTAYCREGSSDHRKAFHEETFFSMETTHSHLWPKAGHLKVEAVVKMPLWCSIASNPNEVVSGRRQFEAGETMFPVEPQYDEYPQQVMWWMKPTKDTNNWGGFESVQWASCN